MKRILIYLISFLFLFSCSGLSLDTFSSNGNTNNGTIDGGGTFDEDTTGTAGGSTSVNYVIDENSIDLNSGYSYSDSEEEIDESDEDFVENTTFGYTVQVAYSGTSATVTGLPSGVTADVSGGDVTITSTIAAVEYLLTGETTDGSFKIYSDKKYKLTLDGVSITNGDGPALNLQSSKRAYISLIQQTINSLADGSTYASAPENEDQKGCIFAEGQIIISGAGSVSLTGNYKHAICTNDYLRIRPGVNLTVLSAVNDGIHTKDSVIISGGCIDITSIGDGIQCEEGGAAITGGTTTIYTTGEKGHGLTALYDVNMSAGAFNVFTTGNGSKGIKTDGNLNITGGFISAVGKGAAFYDTEDADITSCCGLKADGNISISDAKIFAYSSGTAGKGISCDGTFTTSDSEITVITKGKQYTYGNNDSSAKGIKSEGTLTINSGTIRVQTTGGEGSEAIESKSIININGGTVEVAAYDDCINAASQINVSGGNIYTYSSNNDGMDSNGTFSFSGGVTVVSGTTSPEEGFDCDQNRFAITGGLLIGFGGASSTPTSNSCTQNSLVYSGTSLTSGTLINLSSSDGTSLFTAAVPRSYNGTMTVLFSSPSFANGTYIMSSGGSISDDAVQFHTYYQGGPFSDGTQLDSFTSSSVVTTRGSSAGGGFGGGGGGGNPGGGGWR